MIASPEEIDNLEKYFATTPIPKELYLNSAIKITNLPAYIAQVLENLKKGNISEVTLRPRYEDLLIIKQLLFKDSLLAQ